MSEGVTIKLSVDHNLDICNHLGGDLKTDCDTLVAELPDIVRIVAMLGGDGAVVVVVAAGAAVAAVAVVCCIDFNIVCRLRRSTPQIQ